MSERKYLWKTRAGQIALFLLISAIICDSLTLRIMRLYYPYTDIENPNVEWLDRNNWFYINLWIFLDFLIIISSLAIFHFLPEKVRKAILAASLVLGIISFSIALHNFILIALS